MALDTSWILERYAPGSIQGQQLDTNAVISFSVDGSGQVVALESGGTLVRFVPGAAAGSFERTVMIAGTTFSNGVTSGTQVQSFHIDQNGYVIAEIADIYRSNNALYLAGLTPYQLVYFLPGMSVENYFTFNFVSSWLGDSDAPDLQYISGLWVMANGEMLVTIEADGLGIFDHNDYELFEIPPGTYTPNINYIDLYVQSITINSSKTYAVPNINQNIAADQRAVDTVLSITAAVITGFQDILNSEPGLPSRFYRPALSLLN